LGLHRRSIRRRILLLVLIPILLLLGRYTFAVSSAATTGSASAQEKRAFAALGKEMASAPPDQHQRAVIGGTLTGLHRLDQPGGTRSES
jgi:hypothetical protein